MGVEYNASIWYQFKNPALIFPAEREMRFSTPNAQIPLDYYPPLTAKCGIMAHNFAYLADIEEYYPYNFPMFLWEQKEYVTPLQRANVRAAQFMPDALVEVTREGLRSFLKARGEGSGMGAYEEPLVILKTLGYTTNLKDSRYNPEDSVDLRWIKLDAALERVKKVIGDYEHKAAHSSYYCYADMANALRKIYEKGLAAQKAYA